MFQQLGSCFASNICVPALKFTVRFLFQEQYVCSNGKICASEAMCVLNVRFVLQNQCVRSISKTCASKSRFVPIIRFVLQN